MHLLGMYVYLLCICDTVQFDIPYQSYQVKCGEVSLPHLSFFI